MLKKLKLAYKYLLNTHPASGPVREESMGIVDLEFDIEKFYEDLNKYSKRFKRETLLTLLWKGRSYPVYDFVKEVDNPRKTVLIVAGTHGNEQAGILVTASLLKDIHRNPIYNNVNIHVVSPINPIGAANFSRYNLDGTDINRDFIKLESQEAQVIDKLVKKIIPDLIISLHEGSQSDGVFFFANKLIPNDKVLRILANLKKSGIPLAKKDYLGRKLKNPGYCPQGKLQLIYESFVRKYLKMQSLGDYANTRKIAQVTIETPWRSIDKKMRINAQLIIVQSLIS